MTKIDKNKQINYTNANRYLFTIITLIISILNFTCKKNVTGIESEQYHWISGIPFYIDSEKIDHDDRILETDNFLTFSDASSDEVKILYSQMAEQSFDEIKQAFEIQSSEELGIYSTDRNTKITIFSDRYLNHSNMAFPLGFLLMALDSPITTNWFGGDQSLLRDWFRRNVKHETMHVMQWLLGLDWEPKWSWPQRVGRTWPEFWFSEGISEYISGGAFSPIENMEQVNAWLQNSDHINPIMICQSTDAPVSDDRIGEYYPMFGLSVRYLLDDEGLGKSFVDVKEMYLDMQSTVSFEESFENYIGFSVDYYESHFFELIANFLNQSNLNN